MGMWKEKSTKDRRKNPFSEKIDKEYIFIEKSEMTFPDCLFRKYLKRIMRGHPFN